MVNEDDRGKGAMCHECGQMYCGECNVPQRMNRIANCPTCRAPIDVPAEVSVERLLRLIGRSPGRHTPVAQVMFGAMYEHGTGVPQDHTEAMRLFRLAADQGYAVAQYNLGRMYVEGRAVPQDYTEAARLLKLAADQGYQPARDCFDRFTGRVLRGDNKAHL